MNHNKYFIITLGLALFWFLMFVLMLWFKSYRFEQMMIFAIFVLGFWLIYWTIRTLYVYYVDKKNDKFIEIDKK